MRANEFAEACRIAGGLEEAPTGALMMLCRTLLVGLLALAPSLSFVARAAAGKGNPVVVLSTSMGDIKVELYPDKAPITSKNFLDYVKAGYYDGTIFHRVIRNFVVQGGGLGTDLQEKREGLRPPIKSEASNGLKNDAGTIAMARITPVPDSATCQFYINVTNNSASLDAAPDKPGYAVFGKVIDGMDVVKKIEQVKTASKAGREGVPIDPITINSAKILAE
jgi:cyclophilin family peptidyl-prolyl cis-trans isomerase